MPVLFPDQPTGETPTGRMQRRMSAVFASCQTDQQAVDIRGGHRRRIENGLPLGRQFGIRLVRVNGRSLVEHDPRDAPKVKRIVELFAYQPLTLKTLAETLARQGIIYTDRCPKFTKSTLHRVLHNRAYISEVKDQSACYPGTFEPPIDRPTFQLVQERFGTDFKVYRKPQLTFVGGLITCGHCGHAVTGEKKSKRSPDGTPREYSYYRSTHHSDAGHPSLRLTEKQIDQQLLAFFATIRIEDAEARQWFVDVIKAKAHAGVDRNSEHQKELWRQREQINAKLKMLLDLCIDGEITAEDYTLKRQELYERQSAIALQLQTSDRDNRDIAELALKALELSQSVKIGGLRRTTTQNARS